MRHNLEIFLFIDALGWEIVEESNFLTDLLPFRRKIEMQFGYSSSAIPTILSGKRPSEHRHLGLFRFAPSASPFRWLRHLAPLLKPTSLWNRGRIRHWLSKLLGRLCGFTGYFQLYQVPFTKLSQMDYCEKRDLFVPGGMEEVKNLADLLTVSGAAYHISNWRLGDQRNFAAAREAVAQGAEFLFIYTAELDSLLHQFPGRPLTAPILAKLKWYQQQIQELLENCRHDGKSVRLTVISDHGMTPLTQTVDLKGAVERTGLVWGKDYGSCYDSTMFRATFLSPGAEAAIKEALLPYEKYGHWLTAEEEKHYGIYRADRYFGDAIFLMNAGIQIAPSDMGVKPLPGMHGFAPEDKDSYAAILSNAEIPERVQRVSDYFDLMRERIQATVER